MKPNYELRVGLFSIIAIILLLYGWGWLKSASLFHKPQLFIARFNDVAGLPKSATININGVRVGNVEGIDLIGKGDVLVHMKITEDKVVVPQGSAITIQTLGLVGAKYIEITLPEIKPGQPEPAPIPQNAIVEGQNPVRVELVMNNVATKIDKIIGSIDSEKASKDFSDTMHNFNAASVKMNKNMDRLGKAADSIAVTSDNFSALATKAQSLTPRASQFLTQGTHTFEQIGILSTEAQGTTRRLNKILENPNMTSDLKETVAQARLTAESINKTIAELNQTLNNKPVRDDILTSLNKLSDSTQNIYKSMEVLNKIAGDQSLRDDLKQVVNNAKETMAKAEELLSEPNFKADVVQTMDKVRVAATNVDIASRQLKQILAKPMPLLRLMFGRPGVVKVEEAQVDSKTASQTPGQSN